MNLEKNGWIKYLAVTILIMAAYMLHAEELPVNFEHNRFLDDRGHTIHHFNYKIFNNQLTFGQTDDGFVAMLDVKVSVENEKGEKNTLREFTRHIGVRSKESALSAKNYYLDKITISLPEGGIKIHLELQDNISESKFSWSQTLENLDQKSLLSDLEFSHQITVNKPHPGMEQFLRGNYQFYVDPVHIYRTTEHDTVFFYYEIQNLYPAVDGYSYFSEIVSIRSDRDSLKIENTYQYPEKTYDMINRIPIQDLQTGYYDISVTIRDLVRNVQHTTENYFVIADPTETRQRLFADNEKEYHLMRYFLPSSFFRNWSEMSSTAQNNLIDRFWRQNDPAPQIETNEFLETIRTRLEYANRNYAHHDEGWQTDMGRIYIRNGRPDDQERNNIEGDIRLTRREYQIWRYRSLNRVYLFVDTQGLGNFRLLYTRNDDMEQTVHDWERFVGEDFDKSKLE